MKQCISLRNVPKYIFSLIFLSLRIQGEKQSELYSFFCIVNRLLKTLLPCWDSGTGLYWLPVLKSAEIRCILLNLTLGLIFLQNFTYGLEIRNEVEQTSLLFRNQGKFPSCRKHNFFSFPTPLQTLPTSSPPFTFKFIQIVRKHH